MHLRIRNNRQLSIFASLVVLSAAAILAASSPARQNAPKPAAKQAKPAAATSDVDRGRYLEEEVARCWECHDPVGDDGIPDRTAHLQGGPIWIQPVHPMGNWSENAPKLAGLASYTDDQMTQVLEKGIGVNNRTIQPPMHVYHLNHADASAIIAYLRSLPSQ